MDIKQIRETASMTAYDRPISEIYRFPEIFSRTAYARITGKEAPPWNPNKPIKRWFDPAPKRLNTYDVLAKDEGGAYVVEGGEIVIDPLVMNAAEAAAVNLPPDESNLEHAITVSAPLDLQKVRINEKIIINPVPVGQMPIIRDVVAYEAWSDETPGFTVSDRKLLRAIAAKLGISE